MTMSYRYREQDGVGFLTVFPADSRPLLASTETHENFDELVRLVRAGDVSVYEKFDLETALKAKFERLSDRVSIRNGVVYFDGDAVDNALTKKIVEHHNDGEEDAAPLINFMEKVASNPEPDSREQFYRFIEHHRLPITDDGDVILYKSVNRTNEDGVYESVNSGHAIVDGEEVNGKVKQRVGSVVEMPRSEVEHDPDTACHVGLHGGTYDYTQSFSGSVTLAIKVNPRDVVSVPHDWSSAKVRSCRYEVLEVVEKPHDVNVVRTSTEDDDDDYFVDPDGDVWDSEAQYEDWLRSEEDYWDDETATESEDTYSYPGTVWDTRKNASVQPRDARGHFIKGAIKR